MEGSVISEKNELEGLNVLSLSEFRSEQFGENLINQGAKSSKIGSSWEGF